MAFRAVVSQNYCGVVGEGIVWDEVSVQDPNLEEDAILEQAWMYANEFSPDYIVEL
jgi:hypothetical protein